MQKEENKHLVRKKKNIKGEGENDDKLEDEDVQKIEISKDEDDDEINDSDEIKENLKNSAKVYYSVTHSIQEEISE